MSNINSLEPQAFGCIVFKTTFGELELELFTKQCPKATKYFVQLCLDGYYDGTVFNRVEKDFIAIGGKLGTDDEDDDAANRIVSEKFPDEFHSRLKFSRRGLLATANTEKDRNGPEFFFTLGPAPELQNKHTIFGRLKGNSVYCLVDLNECPVDKDLAPLSEKKILEVIVVENPYPDIVARPDIVEELKNYREKPEKRDDVEYKLEPKFDLKTAKKLSFYPESDDEDEDNDSDGDAVSASDKLDPSIVAKEEEEDKSNDRSEQTSSSVETKEIVNEESDGVEKREEPLLSKEEARERRLREIREQIRTIKKQFEIQSATKIRTLSDRRKSKEQDSSIISDSKSNSSKQSNVDDPDLAEVQEFRLATKKGRHRERETLELMENFKKKLKDTKASLKQPDSPVCNRTVSPSSALHGSVAADDQAELAEALELVDSDAWLRHRFDAPSDGTARLANSVDQKHDDWYSMDDPRSPVINRIEADSIGADKSSRSSRQHSEDHRKRSTHKEARHNHNNHHRQHHSQDRHRDYHHR